MAEIIPNCFMLTDEIILTSKLSKSKMISTLYCALSRVCLHFLFDSILVPRAHDPSGLQQKSRALGATNLGMRHRCRLCETGWAEFGYFLCYFKMVAPRTLVFRPLVKATKTLGTRLARGAIQTSCMLV